MLYTFQVQWVVCCNCTHYMYSWCCAVILVYITGVVTMLYIFKVQWVVCCNDDVYITRAVGDVL